jgi:hypothetical protein
LSELVDDEEQAAIPATWRTRNGRTIPVTDLSDAHLRAAFGLMRRRAAGTFSTPEQALKCLVLTNALSDEMQRRSPLLVAPAV